MIQILKASAGSGKTYRLALEYITLLLKSREPLPYRHILAVTFTNKATDEMKRRILRELYVLSTDPSASPYYKDLYEELRLPCETLRARAEKHLCAILHDYSAFAVSTIDRFFQQALRAFSREIGQFASYQVDLDKEGLVQESVDRILDALTEEDRSLLDWLTDSVRADLERGGRFLLEPKLLSVAMSLRSEDHDEAVRRHGVDEAQAFSRERLEKVRSGCDALVKDFTDKVSGAARRVLQVLSESGIDPADSSYGFLKALYKYTGPDDPVEPPTASFLSKAQDSAKWFSKAKDRFRAQLEGVLEEPLEAFCALFGLPFKTYSTALLIREQVSGLGIAAELRREFAALQKEKNVISLDDSNSLLRSIIDGSDAPFIYEKLGVRYEDFLLDEFQDTSSIQWENFRPLLHSSLSGGFENLVVGDVKQSIYRWRGSDWQLLDSRLSREFGPESLREEVLSGNYRTCRGIVQFNNEFFPYAAKRLDNLLGTDPAAQDSISSIYADVRQEPRFPDEAEGSVDVTFCEDAEAEMDEILAAVARVREAGAGFGDIAILVRGNAEGSAIAAALVREGLPVVSDDSLFIKSSVTVRRLVSQMSLVARPADEDKPTVGGFLARSMHVSLPEGYHSLLDLGESLLRDLHAADPASFEAEVPYIQSFMDYLMDWSSQGGNDLSAFLKDWDAATPKIASPDAGGSIRVMTVHKSKGLEFPYVILPFAEKVTLYKNSSYWCAPAVEKTPLEELSGGIYHISLGSGSEQTLFEEDYHRERKLQYIDNINVFYVAMTRAKYGLQVIAAQPPKVVADAVRAGAEPQWKNLSQLLYAFVGGTSSHRGSLYPFGALKRPAAPSEPLHIGYPSYPSGDRQRLTFSGEAADYFGPDGLVGPNASPRLRGLVLHKVLSEVIVPADLPKAVDKVIATGELEKSDRERVLSFLEAEIASVSAYGWFPEAGTVHNEKALLTPDGREFRPDRVVFCPDGWVTVVDYKFGEPKDSYAAQVGRYMSLLRRMGHDRVRGFLWYIREGEQDRIEPVPDVR